MQTVLVLFGGVSPEHAVSLVSAEAVLRNMKKANRRNLPAGHAGQFSMYQIL